MNNITISRGSTTAQLLGNPAFCGEVDGIVRPLHWSTTYQSPAFLRAWYRIYATKFEPVIVTAYSSNSELCGVLCLAVSQETGRLVGGEKRSRNTNPG